MGDLVRSREIVESAIGQVEGLCDFSEGVERGHHCSNPYIRGAVQKAEPVLPGSAVLIRLMLDVVINGMVDAGPCSVEIDSNRTIIASSCACLAYLFPAYWSIRVEDNVPMEVVFFRANLSVSPPLRSLFFA